MKPTLNPALKSFWETKARNKVLYGGRDSTKTWDAAGVAIILASQFNIRFLCTRQFQNNIQESVYTTLKTQIARFGLSAEYTILQNKIIHNITKSEFIFYGLWRNITEIKSLEGVDICWIEEAHNLTEEQWTILEPTLRTEGSEFWIIFNPNLITDFVYQRFIINTPPNTIVRKINYTENPFLSETSKKIIEAKKAEDEEAFAHIYLGEPKTNDDDSIIKRAWIMAAIDSHKKLNIEPKGIKCVGYDVADSGDDTNAIAIRHGILAYHIEEWKAQEHELNRSATRVYSKALEVGAEVVFDSIGVGAGVGSKFKDLNENSNNVPFHKFNAGDSVKYPDRLYMPKITNKDHFANLKAQTWWSIADRLKITYNAVVNNEPFNEDDIISIDSNINGLEKLITELTIPRKDYDNSGRVKVESKKDLKSRGIISPNIADAFVMAYADVRTPPRKEYNINTQPTYTPMARR